MQGHRPSDPPPLQLDYAQPPPTRRLPLRRIILITGILVSVWALVQWGPTTIDRIQQQWAQSRCSDFEFPAGTVIFDTDPAAGQALLAADPQNYLALDDMTLWPAPAIIRREPQCWTNFKKILFPGQNFWPRGAGVPKTLIHRLENAKGDQRLVAIIIAPRLPQRSGFTTPPGPYPIGVVSAIVKPGDWTTPARWIGNGDFLEANFQSAQRLRFFAATTDPRNLAKFTVPYEMDGVPGTIEGELNDNADVVMRVRDGPAK